MPFSPSGNFATNDSSNEALAHLRRSIRAGGRRRDPREKETTTTTTMHCTGHTSAFQRPRHPGTAEVVGCVCVPPLRFPEPRMLVPGGGLSNLAGRIHVSGLAKKDTTVTPDWRIEALRDIGT
ncbi:hypothetical protein PWT90_08196 [Aphanocladium album]|nr:hypothetical protein PWT90_08196 [Aphanocladium album]